MKSNALVKSKSTVFRITYALFKQRRSAACVIYEMAALEKAFDGASKAKIIEKIKFSDHMPKLKRSGGMVLGNLDKLNVLLEK